ncbi:MAG: glycosyl hydrolase [Armatimonadetes bacterium]|nr:glycosyl hydrolase [Armatimonadota bacterium]
MKRLLVILFFVVLAAPALARPDPDVEALLGKMTLEEKLGQMNIFTSDWDQTGPTLRGQYQQDIRRGRVGAIFNAYTPEFTRKLQDLAVKETRLGIPLLFGYDVIHGHRTIFPIPLGEACTWDLGVIEKGARVAAVEASADGLHWTFAPMVDVARDPRWGRIAEGAGEDTWLGSQIARARVRGFQGNNLAAPDALLACVKHYAAYGAAQAGRDYHTVDISMRELWSTYLPPFQAAAEAGAATCMTSFNEIDGVPSTGNGYLINTVLRGLWGFKGFVVTDYTSIEEMIKHGFSKDAAEAGVQAALAGVDMDMQSAIFLNDLGKAVQDRRVPLAVVDDAVRRILRMKKLRGLFANPYLCSDPARAKRVLMSPENRAAARDAAKRSFVLLKNNGVLPLKPALKVALVGPLAEDRRNLIGNWSAAGDGNKAVSVREGLSARGLTLIVAKGCEIEGGDRGGFSAAVATAKKADVVVAVMGEAAAMSGEAASRSRLDLPGVQRDLLAALKATGKPLALILMNGRPLVLDWESENCDAILETWFGGTEAGNAIADVLLGDYNPAGRLVTTFPRAVGQVPIHYNMKNTGRPLDPTNKYTSKYLDVPNDPLYPFGFGLSYTTFQYTAPVLSAASLDARGALRVTATVRNIGKRDGEEVVQLYLCDRVGSVTRPVRELRGFQKIPLKTGEQRTVSFTLTAKDLAFYRRDMSFGAEPGDFDVWIAPNAEAGVPARFLLTEGVTLAPPVPKP